MNTKMTPKDFFLHLGIIVTLYVSAISLIALLFQVINVAFPDALYGMYMYSDPYSGGIRAAIASLIIIFPLFLFISWLLEREYRAAPEKRDLGIKRWLTFLTLFVTGIAIATDLIVLINSFLGGEISTRFALKVLVVLVVAGFVFGYYLWDLRRSPTVSNVGSKYPKIFGIVACILVVASIVGGFVIMGSPTTQRLMRFDATKAEHLQSIQWQIINYWQQKKAVPVALKDLNDPISGFMVPVDPQTGAGYEFKKTGAMSFELCANFNRESRANGTNQANQTAYPERGVDMIDINQTYPTKLDIGQTNWEHGVGRVCFARTIDPQLYPVYSEAVR